MKLIIAGGRDLYPSFGFIDGAIKLLKPYRNEPITEIVCGGASGVDNEGAHWAVHMNVPVKYFRVKKADWDTLGKAAGPFRNKQMAEYADALLLIWDGKSKDSKNMKIQMKKLGKPIYEVILNE